MKKDIMLPSKSLSKQNVIYPILSSKPIASSARNLVWSIFILAIANGVFLYFFPHLAETYYAWAIKPPINAAFMGGGYLAGLAATGLTLFLAKKWRSIRMLFPAFFVLGLSLFLATLIHADRFRWDYALTWMWTLVYFSIPIGSSVIWYLHERNTDSLAARDPRLHFIRVSSLVLGSVVTLLAVLLFFVPQLFLEFWPWQITLLMARVFSGWYFLGGLLLLMVVVSLRQAYEGFITFATLGLWGIFSLLLLLIYPDSFRAGLGFWLWTALHGLLLLQAVWAFFKLNRLLKQERQIL